MTPDDREKRIRARAEDDARLFPEAAAEEWPHAAHDRPFLLAALDEARTALTLERETSAALAEQCRGLAETLRSVTAERTEARERARTAAQILIASVGAEGPCNVEDVAVRAMVRLADATRERDEARQERDELKGHYTTIVRAHLHPSDDYRMRVFREAMARMEGWGM